jgi:SAM-dependent methyltransferase
LSTAHTVDQQTGSRIERERAFHDTRFANNPERSSFLSRMNQGLTHDALRAVYHAARPLTRDAIVLDYGCAQGQASTILHRYGAKHVHGIDISPVAVQQAQQRAHDEGCPNTSFQAMNAEALDFENQKFDLVFGIGILHHLALERAFGEVARVLRPTGAAVFLEPLGHNPMINIVRRLTPHARTADEHPLLMSDLRLLRKYFGRIENRFLNLTTLAAAPLGVSPLGTQMRAALAAADSLLFRAIPWMRRFAWNVVFTLREPIQ